MLLGSTLYLVDNLGASETMDELFRSRDSEILLLKSIWRLNHHRALRHAGPVKTYFCISMYLYYHNFFKLYIIKRIFIYRYINILIKIYKYRCVNVN